MATRLELALNVERIAKDVATLARVLSAQVQTSGTDTGRMPAGWDPATQTLLEYTVVVLRPPHLADLAGGVENAVLTLSVVSTDPAGAAVTAQAQAYVKDMQDGWAKTDQTHYTVLAVLPGHLEPLVWD